ncbi:MAG TPA: hypothetical protein DEQ61_25160, partial [Streptomyces sp.]|nr:hypothetical protein [Streptomyces sp.]
MVTDAPALAGRDHAWTKHDGTQPESPADPDRPEEAPRDDRPPAPRGAGPDRGPNTRTSTGRSTAARNRRSGRAALAVWAVSRLLTLALLHWAPARSAAADRLPESCNTLLGAGLLVGPLPGGDPG